MCKFFSLVSDGKGKIMYFDWKLRKRCLDGELSYNPDSHTSIADYFGYMGKKEDLLNKYEYNPLTNDFVVDQLNTIDDSSQVQEFCEGLDFSKIVPNLCIHDIVHPFIDRHAVKVTKKDLDNLRGWASVRDSVRASLRASVWDSVRDSLWDSVWDSVKDSVRDSVWDSVWASVWDSVKDSVWDSVKDSVWASVGASVKDSVWDSVWAYTSSFYIIKSWRYLPKDKSYDCLNTLWNRGLVPSFDGGIWRLHGGKDAKVLWEGVL